MTAFPDDVVNDLARLPVDRARAALNEILDKPWNDHGGYGPSFAAGLHCNALLVTRLRERGVKIWGTEPVS